jgi:hypothetical protein
LYGFGNIRARLQNQIKEIYDKNILELCMKKQEEFDEKVY